MWGLRLCCLSRRGEAIARGIFTGEGFRATAHARPIASPLRNCRTGPFYHSDRQTPPPLILRRGSARAAPAPPAVITQRSHRGRGVQATVYVRPIASPLRNCRTGPFYHSDRQTPPPLILRRGSARAAPAPPAVVTQRSHRGRGDWTSSPLPGMTVMRRSRRGRGDLDRRLEGFDGFLYG